MKFHIVTLFPEVLTNYLTTAGVVARGLAEKKFEVETYHLREFSGDKHGRVDDAPFGGGAGMVMKCEPLAAAVEHIFKLAGARLPVVNFSPRGKMWTQAKSEQFARRQARGDIILICGRYEGIDQRFIDTYVSYELSIGKYVLAGGELPALVFIESIVRHLPGVLNNPESLKEETFSGELERGSEYPVYTRPEVWNGKEVPKVLLSGNHREIEKWKKGE